MMMVPFILRKHSSASSIVDEFLSDGDNEADRRTLLSKVRKQRYWAFVRISHGDETIAVVHHYAARGVPKTTKARMLGHELGHISGTNLDDIEAEERRADGYASVVELVFKILKVG